MHLDRFSTKLAAPSKIITPFLVVNSSTKAPTNFKQFYKNKNCIFLELRVLKKEPDKRKTWIF